MVLPVPQEQAHYQTQVVQVVHQEPQVLTETQVQQEQALYQIQVVQAVQAEQMVLVELLV
jgi:hypothetical protein